MKRAEPPFTNMSLQRPAFQVGWKAGAEWAARGSAAPEPERCETCQAMRNVEFLEVPCWGPRDCIGCADEATVAPNIPGYATGGNVPSPTVREQAREEAKARRLRIEHEVGEDCNCEYPADCLFEAGWKANPAEARVRELEGKLREARAVVDEYIYGGIGRELESDSGPLIELLAALSASPHGEGTPNSSKSVQPLGGDTP